MNTTRKMSANIWKGIGLMWSVCIKFKPATNWRPIVRQFEDSLEATRFIDECFIKWDVRVGILFFAGNWVRNYFIAPSNRAEHLRKARLQLLGREYY